MRNALPQPDPSCGPSPLRPRGNENVAALRIPVCLASPSEHIQGGQRTYGRIHGIDGFERSRANARIPQQFSTLLALAFRRGLGGAEHGARDGMRERLEADLSADVANVTRQRVGSSQSLIDALTAEHPTTIEPGRVRHSAFPRRGREAEYPLLGERLFRQPGGLRLPPPAGRVDAHCHRTELIARACQMFRFAATDVAENDFAARDDQVAALPCTVDVDTGDRQRAIEHGAGRRQRRAQSAARRRMLSSVRAASRMASLAAANSSSVSAPTSHAGNSIVATA